MQGEEVTFEDLTNNTGKDKSGYKKIRFCGEQARHDGLHGMDRGAQLEALSEGRPIRFRAHK